MKFTLVYEAISKSSDLAALINQLFHQAAQEDSEHTRKLREAYSEISSAEDKIEEIANDLDIPEMKDHI